MGIYRFEWKQLRRSVMIWSVTLGILIMAFTLMFADTVMNEMEDLKELLASNPFYGAMGLDPDNFFSVLGLFSYLNSLMAMAGAVQAASYGMSLISKEYRYNTADFLMTKPYSRTVILVQKVLASLTGLLLTSLVYTGCAAAAIQISSSGDYDLKAMLLICLTFPMIQLIFFSLGLLISAVKCRMPNVLPVSLALAFVSYCLGMGAEVMDNQLLRCLSPFKYFQTTEILTNKHYETGYVCLWLGLTVFFALAAFLVFHKKDISSL